MDEQKNENTPGGDPRFRSLRYAGMGLELGFAIIGLTLAGYWVDYKFDTGPIGMTVGAVVGIVGGMYNFIRQALQMTAEQRKSPSTHDADEDHDRSENE